MTSLGNKYAAGNWLLRGGEWLVVVGINAEDDKQAELAESIEEWLEQEEAMTREWGFLVLDKEAVCYKWSTGFVTVAGPYIAVVDGTGGNALEFRRNPEKAELIKWVLSVVGRGHKVKEFAA